MLCYVMSCHVMLCFCFVLFFVKLMRQKITHYKFKASVSLRRWQESHHVFGCHSSHPHSKRCRICCFPHLSHSFTCFISLCPPHFLLMTQSLSPPFCLGLYLTNIWETLKHITYILDVARTRSAHWYLLWTNTLLLTQWSSISHWDPAAEPQCMLP